ncbi:hypothetical protein BGZ94_000714, partial [Podila epigama]
MSKVVKFEGHNYFRQRLVLATLSGKVLKIEKIRPDDANPGLRGKFFPTSLDKHKTPKHHLSHHLHKYTHCYYHHHHHYHNDTNYNYFEASFLRLLEKVTNGATIEISYT